jgi:hypothetical protein
MKHAESVKKASVGTTVAVMSTAYLLRTAAVTTGTYYAVTVAAFPPALLAGVVVGAGVLLYKSSRK